MQQIGVLFIYPKSKSKNQANDRHNRNKQRPHELITNKQIYSSSSVIHGVDVIIYGVYIVIYERSALGNAGTSDSGQSSENYNNGTLTSLYNEHYLTFNNITCRVYIYGN